MNLKFLKWASAELFFVVSVASSIVFGMFNARVAQQMHLTHTTLGWLSGVFFIAYAIAQFCSGRLFIIYATRNILFISSIIAAVGMVIFTHADHVALLFIARILLGTGLATTFIGILFVVQQNFTAKQFPLLSSISQSLANFTAGVLGFVFGRVTDYHIPFNYLSYALFICSIFILIFLDKNKPILDKSPPDILKAIWEIIRNPQVWYATIFFAGLFGGVLTFPDLFNVSFQTDVFHETFQHATIINGMILLGLTSGGIVSGFWAQKTNYIIPARILSFLAMLAFSTLLFVRFQSHNAFFWVSSIGFLYGFGCSGSILAFQCVQLNVDNVNNRSLATSFVLTMSYVFSGMIEQPLVGQFISNTKITREEAYFINHNSFTFIFAYHDKWYQYNAGLSLILIFISISFISSLFFKNKG
ncbi:MAG: MFS transporter [Burkholderiales bacterium]|nr:MFS transporter [Burkholderiales bacterium]